MASAQTGRVELFGLGTGFANISGQHNTSQFVTARAIKLEHTAKVDEIKGQDGDVNSIIFSGMRLKADIEYIAQGNNAVEAAVAAKLPNFGATANLTGFVNITVGSFVDALNGNTWYYLGGGSVNLTSDGETSQTISLHKFAVTL